MGDDLASDEEYLFDAGLVGSPSIAYSSDDEDGDEGAAAALGRSSPTTLPKRKDGGGGAIEIEAAAPSSNKRRKTGGSRNLLIEAGRGIARDGAASQASFLGSLYAHALKLSSPEVEAEDPFDFRPHLFSHPADATEEARRFAHSNLAAFVKAGPLPSMKRLKNWRRPRCPMVLVVTLSARRSVELTKQLAALKLPVAKLFAKHMSVGEQAALLRGVKGKTAAGGGQKGRKGQAGGRCYGLAVGTPGRLRKLLRHAAADAAADDDGRPRQGGAGAGALCLTHAELIVLDCHEDSKGWTVCTLPDTAAELMEFLREAVVPELERRKGKIKLALF